MRYLTLITLAACHPSTTTGRVRSVDLPISSVVTVVHTLTLSEGFAIRGALTERDGRLYGLAGEAGPNSSPNCQSTANWQTIEHTSHCPGSIFSLRLDGSDFRVDHAFSQLDDHRKNVDGYHPYGTLSLGSDRRLCGAAQMGGSPPIIEGFVVPGYGTLFCYDPESGVFETLHSFFDQPRAHDGEFPMGALAVDAAGDVFGTTKGGGATDNGTIYEWSPGGAFRFSPLPGISYGGPVLSGGLLHLTTWFGVAAEGQYVVVDPVTLTPRVVAEFPSFTMNEHGTDNTPIQEPIALSDGEVLTTREFGGSHGTGVVALLDAHSGIKIVFTADDIPLDVTPRFSNLTGGMLNGRAAEGRDGMIYFATQYGGAAGTGGVVRMARDGSHAQLIWSWPDAAYPYGGLTAASNGAIYGVTFTGLIYRVEL